jgi:hypothetical protein
MASPKAGYRESAQNYKLLEEPSAASVCMVPRTVDSGRRLDITFG